MNELSLFTGSGGGVLATNYLLGWRTLGYVEINGYCQQNIAQRIKDGLLDEAPIFTDIRAFIDQGYAEAYKGVVNVVSAGFPCQPFSQCGSQQGELDDRNMWPETITVIRKVQPEIAWMENVPNILNNKYIRTIFGDLAQSGYNARWCVLGSKEWGGCRMVKDYGYSLLRPTAQCWKAWTFRNLKSLIRKNHADGNIQEQLARLCHKMITPESNEILMMWPEGWSDLKPLEMDKIQFWLHMHTRT